METKKPNNKRNKVVLVSIQNYRCKHNHDKFDTFEDETNDKYFTPGQLLFNVKCRGCGIKIVSGEENKSFRPTMKFPAYTCRNRTLGCRETICHKCAKK